MKRIKYKQWQLIISFALIATASMLALQACGNAQAPFKIRSAHEGDQKIKNQEDSKDGKKDKTEEKPKDRSQLSDGGLAQDEREISFKILEDQFVIRFLDIRLTTEFTKTVVSTRLQFNNEKITIATDHSKHQSLTAGKIKSTLLPYHYYYTAKCVGSDCQRYFLSIMVLKDSEAGNPEGLRDFGIGYDAVKQKSVMIRNRIPEESAGTSELFELLSAQLDKI